MTEVFTHPGQPQMQVEVILASKPADGAYHKPIYTIRMRYPRPIHGEIMTHRVFGRNARSSRAVPVLTMLNEVRNTPYVPWHWGKNQKGMQADEECREFIYLPETPYWFGQGNTPCTSHEAWLIAANNAADTAEAFMTAGYHKQNPNRLLEPFSWIDTLITSTEWDNFLWLRDHKDAEPHLQDLARLVKQAMRDAHIQTLEDGEWHLPYITDEEKKKYHSEVLLKISAARCARISYKPFNGEASIEAELDRYVMLVSSDRVHASPLEHQAKPDSLTVDYHLDEVWTAPHLHGNLNGYIQARKLVANEVYHGDSLYNGGVGVG